MAQLEPMLPLFSDEAPPVPNPPRKDHLTFKANRTQGRHGWLRLTPAYSLHLVEEIVRESGPGARVLDPFCGTGTTALVCAEMGMPCDTVDVNPFLVWLANTKCAQYSAEAVEEVRHTVSFMTTSLSRISHPVGEAWVPPIKDVAKWWDEGTLASLAHAFTEFETADVSAQAHDLLRIVFCRVAIESASVSFGHQSMSFKKPSAVPTLFEVAVGERLAAAFERAIYDVARAAGAPVHANCGRAMLGDSRNLGRVLPRADYTTVITSPPYPNRMSYIRELRPYMYWLGYLETGRQAGELDWKAIGGTWGIATSNLMTWRPVVTYEIHDDTYHEAVARISQRSKVLGTYVTKYFQDVVPHIQSLRDVLVPGATVRYVVGNSKFYDVMLHTEQIYAAILRDHGFQDVEIGTIRKRTSKRELFEFVVSAHM